MTKKEIIWRYILSEALQKKRNTFMQKDIAEHFNFSTSTVFNALKIPRAIGAVKVTGRNFRICDLEKLLLLWATLRNLKKDIVYSTHSSNSVQEIEGAMPGDIIYGAFSAYRLTYGDAPADYSIVYVYSDNLSEIKKRFPLQKGYQNIFVLKPDPHLKSYGSAAPAPQIFADIWNAPEWYGKDFINALKEKLML